MKKLIQLFCLLLLFAACKKSTVVPFQSQGTLKGYDRAECPYCGGIEIIIKDDTTKNAPAFYRINKTFSQLGISESMKFPIDVSLNWKKDTASHGAGWFIIVSQLKVVR